MNIDRKKFTWQQAARQRRLLNFYPQSKGGIHTEQQWKDKFRLLAERCYYCNTKLHIEHAERDHLIPVCRGGSDHIDNIVPACQSCNRKKAWRTADEFIAEFPRLAKKITPQRGTYKPKGALALEVRMNEPGLLKKVTSERERVSWAWRNPA